VKAVRIVRSGRAFNGRSKVAGKVGGLASDRVAALYTLGRRCLKDVILDLGRRIAEEVFARSACFSAHGLLGVDDNTRAAFVLYVFFLKTGQFPARGTLNVDVDIKPIHQMARSASTLNSLLELTQCAGFLDILDACSRVPKGQGFLQPLIARYPGWCQGMNLVEFLLRPIKHGT